jgi:hypothetical protein
MNRPIKLAVASALGFATVLVGAPSAGAQTWCHGDQWSNFQVDPTDPDQVAADHNENGIICYARPGNPNENNGTIRYHDDQPEPPVPDHAGQP